MSNLEEQPGEVTEVTSHVVVVEAGAEEEAGVEVTNLLGETEGAEDPNPWEAPVEDKDPEPSEVMAEVVEDPPPVPEVVASRPGNIIIRNAMEFTDLRDDLQNLDEEIVDIENKIKELENQLDVSLSYKDNVKSEMIVVMKEINEASAKFLQANS